MAELLDRRGCIFSFPRRGAVGLKLHVVVRSDIADLSAAALRELVLALLAENAEQKRQIAELREEIARLKGQPPRPRIKPSGMESATTPKPPGPSARHRGRGKPRIRVGIEDQVLKAAPPPAALMPVWAFEPDRGSEDALLSSATLWNSNLLVEALRVADDDDPTPVPSLRERFDRWVGAARAGRRLATVRLPGREGSYVLFASAAPG